MDMIQWQQASVASIVLFILVILSFEPTSASPVIKDKETDSSLYGPPSVELTPSQIQSSQVEDGVQVTQNEQKEEEELFKDVDPKTLAAVLLQALNKTQEEMKNEENQNKGEKDKEEKEREIEGADRDRDGHPELELVMAAAAAQGREEREREEDEERRRAKEEEDKLTEKVTSHTTSQTVPVKQQETVRKEVVNNERQQESERGTDGEKDEQLSPEELKNLEAVMEEFQSYSTATKRERDSSTGQRASRGEYLDYLDRNGLMNNEIKPKAKSSDLPLSKKKLKWQQELEKDKNRPLYRGGNFMDDFNDNLDEQEEQNNEDEDDDDMLSPEEEEARAKAEQEEVRRQAAEAQRAKAEEEKLADIASDMLLQYMVKQDGKKYQNNNAAEDKRSEEDETSDDDDDIDPQTIDKLIEISSKLHLPADDVVDIISDVEKKKKKDAPENLQWQQPFVPLPAPGAPPTLLRTPPPSKPPKPNTNPFKAWFKDRASTKPSKQDFWFKQQWPFRTYPSYSFYPRSYSSYYPIYISPPKPKPRYYTKPSYSLNDILGNSLEYDFDNPLKQRYRPWTQLQPRAPPAFRRNLYFSNYFVPATRTFKAVPMPKSRSPLRHRPAFYYPPPASVVTRQDDYYRQLGQPQRESDEELENFIEKVFLKRPRVFQ